MVRVSTMTKKHVVGIPYSYYSKPRTLSTFVRNQEIACPAEASTLPSAQIVDETSEFSTRAFVIKYRDERLDLNEGCQFQLLIESRLVDGERLVFEDDEPIQLKLELLMAELEKPGGEGVASEKPSSAPVFTRIASQTLSIVCDPASQQLHAYFPVTFTAMHFCQLEMTVHAALVNLKFRKRGAYTRPEEATSSKSSKKSASFMGGATIASSNADVRYFHQLLFPDDDGDAEIDGEKARLVHHAYLQPMLQSLGATAAALRNMCSSDGDDESSSVPSSRAVAGVMALIKKPHLEGKAAAAAAAAAGSNAGVTGLTGEASTPKKVAACVEADVKLVARRLFLLWGRFVAMLPQQEQQSSAASVVSRLQRTWLAAQRRWWGSRLRNHHVRVQKILQPWETDELDEDFNSLRKSTGNTPEGPKSMLPIYDSSLLKDPSLLPVVASRVYVRRDQQIPEGENNVVEVVNPPKSAEGGKTRRATFSAPSLPGIPVLESASSANSNKKKMRAFKGPHLIVMQHGWYASSFDMRLLRAHALLLFPRAVVLSPQSNEDNTGGSIGPMGQRLAQEILQFIKHRCSDLDDPNPDMGRISFIGHSAGSIIVRAALTSPAMKPYLPKLHAFVSLSSSHCGNMFIPSTLISGGMWALQQMHHSQFMNELQLIDNDKDIKQSYMYKLSQAPGFQHFRYVVLVGSTQDCYVPMHTAHSTIPRPAENDQKGDGTAYMQMATNLMTPISRKTPEDPKQTTVVRLTIDHKFAQTNLDTVIGRAAHLAYIDSSPAVCLVLYTLYNLLK